MNELFDSLLADKSYPNLLLAALGLVQADFHFFLDAYIQDQSIHVFARQPIGFNPEKFRKHPQYLSHFIDEKIEGEEYIRLSFVFPPNCKNFLGGLYKTELPLEDLWVELFKNI